MTAGVFRLSLPIWDHQSGILQSYKTIEFIKEEIFEIKISYQLVLYFLPIAFLSSLTIRTMEDISGESFELTGFPFDSLKIFRA